MSSKEEGGRAPETPSPNTNTTTNPIAPQGVSWDDYKRNDVEDQHRLEYEIAHVWGSV